MIKAIKLAAALSTKKNILVFTDWYLPAYKAGGPIRSLAAMAFYLKDDFNFYILTSNKDAFSKEALPVKTNEWVELFNGEKVFYLADEKVKLLKLEEILNGIKFDLVYLNSFFSKYFSIYPLMLKKRKKITQPVLLAPRGMLGEGALSIKSKKKNLFINLSKLSGLHKNITWHATSEEEVEEIKKIFGAKAEIKLASNLILPPVQKRTNYSKEPGELKMCFVSRISKKKNLLFALEILKGINNGKIIFDVFGPAEDEVYYNECIAYAKKLPSNISISFKGDLKPYEIEGTFKQYHVFFLPTLNENYGHAIVEAMLNGCIPLISDQTPWKNLQKKGIGWDIPLTDKNGFKAAVDELISMDTKTFESQSSVIQLFATKNGCDPILIEAYGKLFK